MEIAVIGAGSPFTLHLTAIEAIACDPAFRDCDRSPGQLLDELLAANQGLVPALH